MSSCKYEVLPNVDFEILVQDIIKRSRQKSELLQGYGDVVAHVECLETDLQNYRMLSARLQSKLDGTIAEYRNEIQSITSQKDEVVGKNKVLRRKKKGRILLFADVSGTYFLTLRLMYVFPMVL